MLTKLKLALLISAPLVAGATTFAVAEGHGDPTGRSRMIEKLDQNGDGQLDNAERAEGKAMFEARRAERKAAMLAKFDTNQDGQLDDAERAMMHDVKLSERFTRMDTNADGQLSRDEFKAGAAKGGFRHHGRHGHGRHRGGGMKP